MRVFLSGEEECCLEFIEFIYKKNPKIPNPNPNPIISNTCHVCQCRPGEMAVIKITPEIYDISDEALSRFTYDRRKCIVNSDITRNEESVGATSEYSQVNCLMLAMADEMNQTCNTSNNNVDKECIYRISKQIGRWKYDKNSMKECLPSCKR